MFSLWLGFMLISAAYLCLYMVTIFRYIGEYKKAKIIKVYPKIPPPSSLSTKFNIFGLLFEVEAE